MNLMRDCPAAQRTTVLRPGGSQPWDFRNQLQIKVIEDFMGVLKSRFMPQMGTADLKKLDLFSGIQRTQKATKSGPKSHCSADVVLVKQEKP